MSYLHLSDLAGLPFNHKPIDTLAPGALFAPQYFPPGTLDPGGPSSVANPLPTSQSRGDGGVEKSVEVSGPVAGRRTAPAIPRSSFMFVKLPKYLKSWIPQGQHRPTVFSIWHFQASVFVFIRIRKAILFLQMILKFETPQINIMTKTHQSWQQARFLGNNHDPAPCTIH